MLNTDFVTHLARKGALRDTDALDGSLVARRRDGQGNLDWVGLTKLTQPVFADPYARNRMTGGMILIDEATNTTVGTVMITEAH